MTAQEVEAIMKPVWEKHPRTKPGPLFELVCEAAMVRWLGDRPGGVSVFPQLEGVYSVVVYANDQYNVISERGATRLEALAAACMAIEEDKP